MPLKSTRTKRGWNGEEKSRGGLLLPIHTSQQKTRQWKGATHKRTRVPKQLVGYQDLGALNALRHP
jgi:hypothetical protein